MLDLWVDSYPGSISGWLPSDNDSDFLELQKVSAKTITQSETSLELTVLGVT